MFYVMNLINDFVLNFETAYNAFSKCFFPLFLPCDWSEVVISGGALWNDNLMKIKKRFKQNNDFPKKKNINSICLTYI